MGFVRDAVTTTKRNSFPDTNIPLNQKLEDKYGLSLAQAIYHSIGSRSAYMFNSAESEYVENVNYALGRQPEGKYKPLLRINPDQPNEQWMGALRWAIKNYATKRLNIAISKMSRRVYDPIVDPIDRSAVSKKDEVKNKIKAYIEHKEFFAMMTEMVGKSFLPEEVDPDLVPETVSELFVWMDTEFKFIEASYLEKAIAHSIDRNKYSSTKRMIDFDIFAHGVGVGYVGMDGNMLPEIEHVDVGSLIVPATKKEDFSDVGYVGQLLYPTVNEFKKMAAGEFSDTEIKDIIYRYAKVGTSQYRLPYDKVTDDRDERVPLMRFVYKSSDEVVKVKKTDKYNNQRFLDKDYNQYRTAREQEKFKEKYGKSRKLYRKPYYNILEGYWIVGSEAVFRYGMMSNQIRPRGSLSESLMPYKFFAPNIKDNKPMSTVRQMIPVLDELQSYHIKKQHVIASAFPTGVAIDLNALRNSQFKWNNKNMTDQDKLQFFMQTGVFVHDPGQKYLSGSGYKPVYELKSTQLYEVEIYLKLIQESLMELDEIIGINKVTAASTLSPEALKGTSEMMKESSEVALDYLYRADEEITLDIYRSLGILTDQSIRYKDDDYWFRVLGEDGVKTLKKNRFVDYGYTLSMRPTDVEWADFYREAETALGKDQIGFDDLLDLKAIDNLKEARALFKVKIKKLRTEKQALEREKIESTLKGQQQSNVQAHQNQVQLEEVKTKGELQLKDKEFELEMLKHKNKMEEIELEKQLLGRNDLQNIERKSDTAIEELIVQDRLYETSTDEKGDVKVRDKYKNGGKKE